METKFDRNDALELIKVGLQSGSIRLKGSAESVTGSQAAERDSAYLLTLFTELQKGLTPPSGG